jgi:hypothetical protein
VDQASAMAMADPLLRAARHSCDAGTDNDQSSTSAHVVVAAAAAAAAESLRRGQ